jgi:hypothetical protein
MIEYEFTLADGSKRYEFVDPDDAGYSVMSQIIMFQQMHKAITARPFKNDNPPN